MFDDIMDLFNRDRNRQRPGKGLRGMLNRLGDHDDDRSSTRHRDHDDDWDDDDHRPRENSGRRRRESSVWDD